MCQNAISLKLWKHRNTQYLKTKKTKPIISDILKIDYTSYFLLK